MKEGDSMKPGSRGFLLMDVLLPVVLLSVFACVAFRGVLAGRRMDMDASVEEGLRMASRQRLEEVKESDFAALAALAETEEDGSLCLRQELGEDYVMETRLDPLRYRQTEKKPVVFHRNSIGKPRLLAVETAENFVLTPEGFGSLEEDSALVLHVAERGTWVTLEIYSLLSDETEEAETEEIYSGRKRVRLEENGTRMENRGYVFFPDELLPGTIYVEGSPKHEMELYLIFGETEPDDDCLLLNGFPAVTVRTGKLRLYTNLDGGLPVAEEKASDCLHQITVTVYEAGADGERAGDSVGKEVFALHGVREAR